MIERRRRARLAFEARELSLVLHENLRQELERHASAERLIQGEINFPHAACAKLSENAIVPVLCVRSNLFIAIGVDGELSRGQTERVGSQKTVRVPVRLQQRPDFIADRFAFGARYFDKISVTLYLRQRQRAFKQSADFLPFFRPHDSDIETAMPWRRANHARPCPGRLATPAPPLQR